METPFYSIILNPYVRGKGTLATIKPEKKKETQAYYPIVVIIIDIYPFIISPIILGFAIAIFSKLYSYLKSLYFHRSPFVQI